MIRLFATLFIVALTLSPRAAHAYPEMVRHGYVNCVTCHVSPNGGGVLTSYGRALSGEALSTWVKKTEKFEETNWMYAVKPPEWLQLGGDVRWLQYYINNARIEKARFFYMQGDAEAAVTPIAKLTAVATGGIESIETDPSFDVNFISRRHYLLYQPSEKISLRAGRFYPAFGINSPQHMIYTRGPLGFDQNQETYNLEGAWIDDTYDVFVTGIFRRPNQPQDSGAAVRASLAPGERYKVGVSYLYGTQDTGKRHAVGPYAILGFTPRFFLLAENDFVRTMPTGQNGVWGVANYGRLDYEFIQGVHGYVMGQILKPDFNTSQGLRTSYGVGAQWFPRPHFEFQLEAMREHSQAFATDAVQFLLHFYP